MNKEEKGANFTLLDLKAIEKPIVKLIETVRDGVGAVDYLPSEFGESPTAVAIWRGKALSR
jgi:hypothetical protein